MGLQYNKPIIKKDPTDTEFTTGKAVFISFMSIINVFMLFGNILSIITITTNKSLRKHVSYWFVLNLAIVDFLIAVTVIPLNTVWEFYGTWPLSSAGCEIFTFADISFSTISAYSIVLVSVDKYVYITHPMQYFDKMTKKVTVILIIGIWILVIIFTIVSVTTEIGTEANFRNHFYTISNDTKTCIFVMTDAYVIPSAIICFFIPFSILCFTSSKIICIASNHIRRIHEMASCVPSDTNSELRNALSVKYQTPKVTRIPTSNPVNSVKQYKTRADSPNLTNGHINKESLTDGKSNSPNSNGCVRQLVDQSNNGGEINPAFDDPDNQIDDLPEGLQRDRTVSILDETQERTGTQHSPKLCTSTNPDTCDCKQSYRKHPTKQTESMRTVSKKKYPYCKLFGTVTIVIVCFVIMFSPYYIATMLDVGCHCVQPWVYEDILSVLYYMHSLVNPYIYMSTDRKYKAALKLLYRKIKQKVNIT